MKNRTFARILHDPPFHCGFHPDQHSFREYVQHIENCRDWECERRYTNHLLLKVEFARRYGTNEDRPAGDTISANEHQTAGASVPSAMRPAFPAKA